MCDGQNCGGASQAPKGVGHGLLRRVVEVARDFVQEKEARPSGEGPAQKAFPRIVGWGQCLALIGEKSASKEKREECVEREGTEEPWVGSLVDAPRESDSLFLPSGEFERALSVLRKQPVRKGLYELAYSGLRRGVDQQLQSLAVPEGGLRVSEGLGKKFSVCLLVGLRLKEGRLRGRSFRRLLHAAQLSPSS